MPTFYNMQLGLSDETWKLVDDAAERIGITPEEWIIVAINEFANSRSTTPPTPDSAQDTP